MLNPGGAVTQGLQEHVAVSLCQEPRCEVLWQLGPSGLAARASSLPQLHVPMSSAFSFDPCRDSVVW